MARTTFRLFQEDNRRRERKKRRKQTIGGLWGEKRPGLKSVEGDTKLYRVQPNSRDDVFWRFSESLYITLTSGVEVGVSIAIFWTHWMVRHAEIAKSACGKSNDTQFAAVTSKLPKLQNTTRVPEIAKSVCGKKHHKQKHR